MARSNTERPEKQRMTRRRVEAGQIAALWDRHSQRWDEARKRIELCRDVRNGKQMFSLPPEFDVPGAEGLVVTMPQKMTVPLKTVNVLGRKRPRLRRHPVGTTMRANLTASNIETWVNAAVEKKTNWGKLIGSLFLDGEAAVIVTPSLAHWENAPDFMDAISQEEYNQLDDETKERYRRLDDDDEPIPNDDDDDLIDSSVRRKRRGRAESKGLKNFNPPAAAGTGRYAEVDGKGRAMPHPRYLRDSKGRGPDDDYYDRSRKKFKEDRKQSRKAFEDELQHWLAEELPFEVMVVSATECVPIFGTEEKLEALIVRRTFSKESLIARDYVWDEDGDMLSPEVDDEGEVTLLEYWGTDKDGTPYVSYSVNGVDTYFRNGEPSEDGEEDLADAVIDLRKEFGLRKLPVKYCWGLHWETDDYKMKGVPFLWPVLGAITGVEALSTSILVHSYNTAFGSWGVAADPAIFNQHPEAFLENGKPRHFTFAPLTTTILPGKPFPLVHPGVGKDVKDLLNMLMSASASMAPADTAFGGGNAASGHDRALSREYLETSMDQVLQGALQAYGFIAEHVLEICVNITKQTGTPIPVYATVPTPQITGEKNRSAVRRQMIELKPDWVGIIYNLESYYPKSAGENLAELQQLAQLHLQGLVTFREFREKGFGDENPAATLIEIFTDQYLRTDAGKAEIAQMAAEMMGADADVEKQKLIDEGRLTAGGTPLAALPPELVALNTGEIPPGVDPELFLTKLRGMMAHDAARQQLRPQSLMGPISAPGGPGGGPPGPGAMIPPAMNPQGAPGPAGPAPGGSGEQAPTLPGMSVPNLVGAQMGGIISGEMGTAAAMNVARARSEMGGGL